MKKSARILLTSLPIVGAIAGTGTFIAVKMNQGTKTDNSHSHYEEPAKLPGEKEESLFTKFRVFPELNSQTFYKYIKIEKGKPYINDEFISRVVNKVLKETNISDGTIDWGYELSDDKQILKITFKWVSGRQGRVFSKTYKFNISNVV